MAYKIMGPNFWAIPVCWPCERYTFNFLLSDVVISLPVCHSKSFVPMTQ